MISLDMENNIDGGRDVPSGITISHSFFVSSVVSCMLYIAHNDSHSNPQNSSDIVASAPIIYILNLNQLVLVDENHWE